MTYPKPLSRKSLDRMYQQSGLSAKVTDFLHSLFLSCTNLYGAIALRDVWNLYLSMKESSPKVKRKELVAFAAIARREKQPYYVFQIEELYEGEQHNELDSFIVSKELVGRGYGKYIWFYELMERCLSYSYCVPENILQYADCVPSDEEKALLFFLGNLRSSASECNPPYGDSYPNEHQGKNCANLLS